MYGKTVTKERVKKASKLNDDCCVIVHVLYVRNKTNTTQIEVFSDSSHRGNFYFLLTQNTSELISSINSFSLFSLGCYIISMVTIRDQYVAYGYGIPMGTFGLAFVILSIIHRRANWFILNTILGIDWEGKNKDDDKKSEEKQAFNKYLNVDISKDEGANVPPLWCIVRFVSDIIASAVIGIFASILLESLIIARVSIKVGEPCPDFDAECFGVKQYKSFGPFNCTIGGYTNFSVPSSTVQCIAWVYQRQSIHDVLEAIGTCGGLIGIIASIVPLVYYFSYYKKNLKLNLVCIILPLGPFVAGGVVFWYSQPEGPSNLTVITFAVVIAMSVIGWSWAFYRSYFSSESKNKCCTQFLQCKWPSKCCSLKCCSCIRKFLCRKYKYYPWCCFYYCCCRNCCPSNACEKYSVHEDDVKPTNSKNSALPAFVVTVQSPQRR